MFYIDSYTHMITLTKGDTAEIEVKVKDANGVDRPIYDDDMVFLTVRKTAESDVAFKKTAVQGVIKIEPEDTKELESGKYVYDVELKAFTGNIYTIIPASTFLLEEEITR